MPFEEDTEPTAEDPLGLGGELGTGTENPTMQSYGNYDVLNRLAKARQSALDLPSRLAKIKDTKVKSVITRIIPEFNNPEVSSERIFCFGISFQPFLVE